VSRTNAITYFEYLGLTQPTHWLLIDCVSPKYSKYVIAFVPLTYLSAYFKFLVHFVTSSHLKYVWITHSKCGSAIQLEQLEEFVCDTYFTHILNVWIQKRFSHILTTHFAFVGKSIVKYLLFPHILPQILTVRYDFCLSHI
jgi:hypothetical protein